MDLIVFIVSGVTHRFHNVDNLKEEDGKITFDDYVGLSTGKKRTTYFTNYSGYSFYPETHN